MPVTIQVAEHPSKRWDRPKVTSDHDLLKASCHDEYDKYKSMVQSSFSSSMLQEHHISPVSNGLVSACFQAYSNHHHLTLRPEDVWFAILSQTGFFINAHAEEVRHLFVAHDGQKELIVEDGGNAASADFGKLAQVMTMQIQKNVLDPDLRAWVMPDFSTTTNSDRVVASILFMGAMKEYFSYVFSLACGIPSVTLLGDREDWVEIQRRIPKLEQLGNEPTEFAKLLRPILSHFIESFDHPASPRVKDFWSKIAHESGGSGPRFLSGWITAFCFWDADGNSFFTREGPHRLRLGLELDGNFYHRVKTNDIPVGFASVPVTVNDNGHEFSTNMIAGSVGLKATASDSQAEHRTLVSTVQDAVEPTEERSLDSIQPVSGWWMFKVDDPKEGETQDVGQLANTYGPSESCRTEAEGRVASTMTETV